MAVNNACSCWRRLNLTAHKIAPAIAVGCASTCEHASMPTRMALKALAFAACCHKYSSCVRGNLLPRVLMCMGVLQA